MCKFLAFIVALAALDSARAAILLPPTQQADWAATGIPGGIPFRTKIFADVTQAPYNAVGDDATDNRAAIQAAITACPAGEVVYIPAGIFRINGELQMKSNITVRGAGQGVTIIKSVGGFKIGGTGAPTSGAGGRATFMFGTGPLGFNPSTYTTDILPGADAGDTSIDVASATGIAVGTLLVISETNDPAYVDQLGGLGNASWVDGWNTAGERARGQIVEVTNVAGTTVTFAPALYTSYTRTPWASRFQAECENSGLESLTIYATNSGMARNIWMQKAKKCWVYDVESDFCDGDPITIDWSYRCEIRRNNIHDAFIHQSGNFDSQLALRYKSSACRVEDNILFRLHVAIMLEWGAAGNVIAYNYSAGHFDTNSTPLNGNQFHLEFDLNPNHGAHPQFNLFEGNIVNRIAVDYIWGTSSDQTFLRNWAKGAGFAFPPYDGRGAYDPRTPITSPNARVMFQSNRGIDIWNGQSRIALLGNIVGDAWHDSNAGRVRLLVNPTNRSYTVPAMFTFGYAGDGDTGTTIGGSYVIPNTNPPIGIPLMNPMPTLIELGNFDFESNSIVNAVNPVDIPDSYYRASRPSWFGRASVLAWPPIEPDQGRPVAPPTATNPEAIIPAGYRFFNLQPPPQAPAILTQPADTTTNSGGTAALRIYAEGYPLAYQWKKNGNDLIDGGNVSGATTNSLILTSVTGTDADTYSVVVSNVDGTVTSDDAVLTVTTGVTPTITSSATPPAGTYRSAFSYQITTDNGVVGGGPNPYALTVGTLPTGVTLNTSSGLISGTPTSSGTFPITLTATNSGGPGTPKPITITINRVPLTVSGITASNKVYNGTTEATLSTGSAALVGVLGGDIVTLNTTGATGTFADRHVGVGKTVTVSGLALNVGGQASNYTLTQPTTTANITTANLTVTGVTANNKVYNANTAATPNMGSATLAGVPAADVGNVTLNFGAVVATFANANVGNGKIVTLSGLTLDGSSAPNYTLTQSTTTANITPSPLSITGVTAGNKVYNGNTATSVTGTASLVGVHGADAALVLLNATGATATFADANVGTGKAVTFASFAVSNGGNYTLAQPPGVTANITAASLTVSGVTASSKIYNGLDTATLNPGSAALVGVIGGDSVTLNTAGATGTFADRNVGVGKTVTVAGLALNAGGASANYILTQPTTTATITAKALTASGTLAANNKVYDDTTAASFSGAAALQATEAAGTGTTSDGRPYSVDSVTLGGAPSGTFASENVANGIGVTVTGLTLGGTGNTNYTLTQPTGLSANITPAALTITGVTANNKVYNNTTGATLNTGGAILVGVPVTDTTNVSLNVAGATATFADALVGAGKAVAVSGIVLSGTSSGNYTLSQPVGVTGNITPAPLTVTGVTAGNKIYDGLNTATLNTGSAALVGVIGGDIVTLNTAGLTATFADRNVGAGKTVTAAGLALAGGAAGNYTLSQPTTTATITPKALTSNGTLAPNNKVYDDTTAVTFSGAAALQATEAAGTGTTSDGRPYSVDSVTLGGAAAGTFANENVANGIGVTVTGLTLGGTGSTNYSLVQPAGLSANITPATLTVTGITASNKVYNSNTAATLTTVGAALVGVPVTDVGNVSLNFAGATATFTDALIGPGKAVTVTGLTLSGPSAANYTLTQPAGITADITGILITVTGITASNKVYDATTTATINTGSAVMAGVVGADVGNVILNTGGATGTFANATVGVAKTVTVAGLTLGGPAAGNYTLIQPTAMANITAVGLTVTGITASNKVYNANLIATLNTGAAALVGVVPADAANVTLNTGAAVGTFATTGIGVGKAVTISGLALAGTSAPNYTLTQPAATADITAAPLTVTGVTASNKVYNGNTTATLNMGSAALSGVPGPDVANITLSVAGATGTFANANVGAAKPVTVTGLAISGISAPNYTFTQPVGITADITAATATITLTNLVQVFDGTPKSVTATTTPVGLASSLSYDGSGIAPSAFGDYAVIATITDPNYTGITTGVLFINNPGAPAVTSSPTATGTVGVAFSYTITGTNSPTSYAIVTGTLPGGLSLNTTTGLISGQPLAGGSTTVTIGATNANGTGTGSLAFTISGPLPTITITSPTEAKAVLNQPFSYAITASEAVTSYGAINLPAGVTLNAATGIISGQFTAAGSYTIIISATKPTGTATGILVVTANSLPMITLHPQSAGLLIGGSTELTAAATSSPAATVQWQKDGINIEGH